MGALFLPYKEEKMENENNVMNENDIAFISAEERVPTFERVNELIEVKQYARIREELDGLPTPDIAELIEMLDAERRVLVYRLLPKDTAAEVFVEMNFDTTEALIEVFSDKELSETLAELYIDDAVDIIEEMPASVVKRIMRNCSEENRNAINQLLQYPKDSAGSIMTTEYVRLLPNMTVEDALLHIRRVAIDKETVYTCYVTDKDRHLIGIVTAKALMLAERETEIAELMNENVIFATTVDDQETVANLFNKYGFIALPVTDAEHRLVGIVTVDDAMTVMREEAEEDFAKMAAIIPERTEYLRTPAVRLFLARLPWLLLLMISATFSSAILSFFEASLIPVLVLFVPMLMDTGGNSGSQASVTAIRGLSTGEIELSDALRVLWKEIRVGAMCGAVLGVVAFGKVMLVDRLIMNNPSVTLIVALSVSIALTATVLIAKIIGSTLPLLARRLGFDPAVMASPFITTIVDAIGLIVYYLISANVFGLTV